MMTYKVLRPEFHEQQPCSCCSVAKLCPTLCSDWSLLKFMSIELVMPSNHLIFCCPLLLPPSIFPRIRVFSSESALRIRWPNYWSFSFKISPSNEYSGLISLRIDWFAVLAVKGTVLLRVLWILKSLLQHCRLVINSLHYVEVYFLCINFENVYQEWILNFTRCFFCVY